MTRGGHTLQPEVTYGQMLPSLFYGFGKKHSTPPCLISSNRISAAGISNSPMTKHADFLLLTGISLQQSNSFVSDG